jgi:hypothetical protein
MVAMMIQKKLPMRHGLLRFAHTVVVELLDRPWSSLPQSLVQELGLVGWQSIDVKSFLPWD